LKRSEIATQDAASSLTAVLASCPAAHDLAGGDTLPSDLNATMKVGAALILCGTASWQGREFPTGKKQLSAAMDIFTQLVAQAPNRNEFSGDLALAHERYGRILNAEGDLDGAIRESRQDVALRSGNLRKFPNNVETKTALAMSEFILAGMLKQRGNLDSAKEAYGRCATLRREAIAGNGTNPLLQGPLKTCDSALLQFGPDTATTDQHP
jgi:tetratricopeptide (TPR) repeat protein